MNIRHLLHVVGAVLGAIGLSMLAPVVVALIYQEWDQALGIAGAAANAN